MTTTDVIATLEEAFPTHQVLFIHGLTTVFSNDDLSRVIFEPDGDQWFVGYYTDDDYNVVQEPSRHFLGSFADAVEWAQEVTQ